MESASKYAINPDVLTLTRFILCEQMKFPYASGEFTQLLISIQTAVKVISSAVKTAGFEKLYAYPRISELHAQFKTLSDQGNDFFVHILKSSNATCAMVSTGNEDPIYIDDRSQGKYIVCFSPLDASEEMQGLGPFGSVFAVYRKPEGYLMEFDLLQAGKKSIVIAGYAIYAAATTLVLSLGENYGVHGFLLDPEIDEFILTNAFMKLPMNGHYISIDDCYADLWDDVMKEYYDLKKNPEYGEPYEMQFIGSYAADVNGTLAKGGISLYPAFGTFPDGQLRVLCEANPLAFIIDSAGGMSTTGKKPVLDLIPETIDEKIPCFMGSREDVEELLDIIDQHNE